MIRRGFWLVLGATVGVSGYRRLSRLASALRPAEPGAQLVVRRPVFSSRRVLAGAARAGRGAAASVAFVRDVRDGVAEYPDRRQVQAPRTLESQRERHAPGGAPREAGRRAAP